MKKLTKLLDRKAFLGVLLFLLFPLAYAAPSSVTIEKFNPGERDQQFVQRVAKADVHIVEDQTQLARTSKLLKETEVLIAFTDTPSNDQTAAPQSDDLFDITLNIFLKTKVRSYRYLEPVVACEVEGGSPAMSAVFYVNLFNQPRPVIGVICGWRTFHPAVECPLNDAVRLFRINDKKISVVPMQKYEAILYKKVKSYVDEKFECTTPNFRSAADVIKLLEKAEN